MDYEEKIRAADEVMERMSTAFGVTFTEEQKWFNRGYLIAMIDAAKHNLFSTAPPTAAAYMDGSDPRSDAQIAADADYADLIKTRDLSQGSTREWFNEIEEFPY